MKFLVIALLLGLYACGTEPVEAEPVVEVVESVSETPEPTVEPEPEPDPTPEPTETTPSETPTETEVAEETETAPEAVSYANCTEVREAGASPIKRGDPGWSDKFDRDGDGVGCE